MAHTGIDICDHDLGALIGKKPSCLGADTLTGTGDNGHLTSKKAGWVVEVLIHLIDTVGRRHCDDIADC